METANATAEPLVMFVIYDHPTDFPGCFVCRRWFVFPGEEVARADVAPYYIDLSLEAVRLQIPRGLCMLPRFDGDDPKIVETWL